MGWPIYFKDSLIVGNPVMDTAVISLWTPKEVVSKGLDMSSISLVGHLYTKRGINFVIRNILANPRIRKLYFIGADLSNSGQSFLDYKFNLDEEVDLEAFQAFKQNVKLIDNRKITAKNEIRGEKGSLWRKPQVFREQVSGKIETFPSEFSNITIRDTSTAKAWVKVLETLLKFGVISKPVIHYDNQGSTFIRELLNLEVVLDEEDPANLDIPSFMPFTRKDINVYINNFFKKGKGGGDYTYGERLFDYNGFDQVARMSQKLKQFPQDKGALCVLWKPKEDSYPHYKSQKPKRVPCLILIQGQVYEGKLYLTAYFRSNDMGSAWPLNVYALRALQSKIASELGVSLGSLITISNMAHLYERDYHSAQKIVKDCCDGTDCVFDPRGNMVIRVEGKMIMVDHISPTGGRTLNRWKHSGLDINAARILGDKILSDMAISQTAHAMDIGRQLARAQEAIRRGLVFTQDRPLPL